MVLETGLLLAVHLLIQGGVIVRILLRPHRQPASRIAWIAVVAAIPLVGVIAYLAVGETNIGRRNLKSMGRAVEGLSATSITVDSSPIAGTENIPLKYTHLFNVGRSISGFQPTSGNSAALLANSNASIDHMVADIDAACHQVNLLFYIWLTDNNGTKIAAALQRAAHRGVTCRAMVDGLGSRALLRSSLWRDMKDSGVRTAVALPLGNPLVRPLQGRVDLRNHRKILVIDGHTTYCGSQNCADPEFRVKAKYAPWVDSVVRFEGAVAAHNQLLFATDWLTYAGEKLDGADPEKAFPVLEGQGTTVAQVVASGPTLRHSAMPEMFASLIYSAREELTISTPYYVPDETMQAALCAAAYRGVRTTLILPSRNDSWEVAAASRSYYQSLLQAGVDIQEYVGGLLHSKTLTLDGDITLIGSANMDRRSFDLNYENNILCYDPTLTRAVRQRQQSYIDSAEPVTLATVEQWPKLRQLWNNTVGMMGPVL